MASTSKNEFLSSLRRSGIIDDAGLEEKIRGIKSKDPLKIARSLIKDGTLTRWQAKYLTSGRTKLRIGNYLLLERLRRDEYGDRFLATHEQLHRRVEIQLIPDELTADEAGRERFTDKAGLASTIDHPNLVHVYDVDQVGGRYFLILEHIGGKTLAEKIPSGLVPLDAAKIVRQTISGLTEAHANRIVHGKVSPRNIFVSSDYQIKIQNMLLPSLMEPDNQHEPVKDINNAAKVGCKLLKKIRSDSALDADPDVENLNVLLKKMARAKPEQLDDLTSELDEFVDVGSENPGGSIILEASVVASARKRKKTGTGIPQLVSSESGRRQSGADDNKFADAEATSGLTGIYGNNPVLFLSGLALASLLLIGGLGYSGWTLTHGAGSDNGTSVADGGSQAVPSGSSLAVSDNIQNSNNDTENNVDPDSPEPDSSGLMTTAQMQLRNAVVTSGDQPEGSSAENNTTDVEAVPDVVVADTTPDLDAGDGVSEPDSESPEESMTASPEEPMTALKPEIPIEEPVEKATEVPAVAEETQPVATTATAAPAPVVVNPEDANEPFKALPRSTDLPEFTSTEPHTIGTIYVPNNYLLKMELISSREISKKRALFEISRTEADKQRWEVVYRSKKNDDPLKVAEFWRKDNQIGFAWTSEAATEEAANYLRNCHLKMTGNKDKIAFLPLRSPVVIESFTLNAENLETLVETKVGYLPHEDSIRLMINSIARYEGIQNRDTGGELHMEPRIVGNEQSAIYYFRRDVDQCLMIIEVVPDIVKQQLVVHSRALGNNGGNWVSVSVEDVNQLALTFQQAAEQLQYHADQISSASTPTGMTITAFEAQQVQARKDAKAANLRSLIATEKQTMLPAITSKNIPFVVYFEIGGIRTELAICNTN